MEKFIFEYKGESFEATYKHYFTPDGYDRFRIDIPSGESFVIMRFGMDKRFWLQAIQFMEEVNFPIDFIQSVGEAIDRLSVQEDAGG
jgi:hypothetical protein